MGDPFSWLLRRDPLAWAAFAILLGVFGWSLTPDASGMSATSDLQVQVTVPSQMVVVPGQTSGDTSVNMPDLGKPNLTVDASSDGWQWTTNYASGYEVRIRSTTDPAMSGKNAIGGHGARSSFLDFSTATACPCPWSTADYSRGVFGYTADVSTTSGPTALDTDKWGHAGSRRWRGLDNSPYAIFRTTGGVGVYSAKLYFRSAVAADAVQPEGLYRASVIISAHPRI